MYFLISRPYHLSICIVFLLIVGRIPLSEGQFVLSTLAITQNGQSFTVPYNNSFANVPTNYAYFIQSGTINKLQFYLKHDAAVTSVGVSEITIKFVIEGVTTMSATEMLQVRLMVSAYPSQSFTLTILSTTPATPVTLQLPVSYNPAAIIKDLQVKVFVLNIPMTHTKTINSTHLSITPTKTPTNPITQISFSVLVITRHFASYHVGLLIDDVKLGNLGWIIIFNNDSFFDPSDSTMLIGITSYAATSNPVLDLQNGADYNFSFPLSPDKRSIFVYYDIDSTPVPTVMDVGIFLFSQIFKGCQNNGFLTYTELYYDSPLSCMPCHSTCVTCTTANYSLTMTDEFSCLKCGPLKYFLETSNGSGVGQCKCYPGLEVDNVTQECLPCKVNCFGFTIDFMRSSTQSQFLLKFSSLADLLIPMTQNLKIYINSTTSAHFKSQQIKPNFYQIIVPPQDMTACNTKCLIKFQFSSPWKVLKKGKNQALSDTIQTLQVENYYVVADKFPQELDQAFTISTMLVGAAAGGGLSSILKMLFEIEQMIEFHKYLNMEMPLIFKEFIESLSIFKFLDITTVFPFDIDAILQDFSTSEFNTKGPIKAVYYQFGVNFYKNIIPVVVSFAAVLLINFLLFFVLRLIPCKLFWKLSEKLRVRALITISDLVETMIIPIMVFAHFQFSIVYYRLDIIWIYAMAMGMVFLILFIPFLMIAHTFMNQHNKQMKDVYEDLLNDCHLNRPATYAFFIVSYYRKIFFGLSLLNYIPGMIQGYCVISVNGIYLGFILYVVSQKIFNSKLKMLTKTLNVLCVIGIEGIMIYYNYERHSIGTMLELGSACVYLAIIATITGVCEAFIKIFEIICQNVKDIQSDRQVNVQAELKNLNKLQRKQSKLSNALKNPIYSHIGNDQTFLPFNSKDSLETASVETKDKHKVSVLNRARKKLGFLANLNRKNHDNSKSSNDQTNIQGESFEQMMEKIDGEGFVGMDSMDELGYSIRKKQTIKKRVSQKKSTLQSKQSYNPQINGREPTDNKIQQANSLLQQNQSIPKPQKNLDKEIQAIQQRMRQKRNMKKQQTQQVRPNINIDSSTIEHEVSLQNRRNSNSRRQLMKRQNKNNEPTTQRVKNEEKDEKMMENINEKKTARRKISNNRKVDSLKVMENRNRKKRDLQEDEDDIYYAR